MIVAREYTSIPHVKSCTDNVEAMEFVCCLKHFHDKTTTNYHILGLRGCFHGLSWYACVRRACFRPACFFFVFTWHVFVLCVFRSCHHSVGCDLCLRHSLDISTNFSLIKRCRMEDENAAISVFLTIMLVQHWEFDVIGGAEAMGACVWSFPLIIDRLILLVSLIIGACSLVC